jgi:hypothetical protein
VVKEFLLATESGAQGIQRIFSRFFLSSTGAGLLSPKPLVFPLLIHSAMHNLIYSAIPVAGPKISF